MSKAIDLIRQWAEMRQEAEANLPRLAAAVRSDPTNVEAKAAYNEAKEIISTFRKFERGGNPLEHHVGNTIGFRGIAGTNISVTYDDAEPTGE